MRILFSAERLPNLARAQPVAGVKFKEKTPRFTGSG